MTINFKRFVLLLATIALLASTSGCAVSEKTCLKSDWQSLGYKHGKSGQLSDGINRYTEDCAEHGVTPDASAYKTGHDAGIVLYCTAENGSKEAKKVNSYSGACPAELETTFLKSYLSGLQAEMSELEIEYDRDSIQLDELRANRDRLASAGESFTKDDKRIVSLTNDISSNADKRTRINDNLREWGHKL